MHKDIAKFASKENPGL